MQRSFSKFPFATRALIERLWSRPADQSVGFEIQYNASGEEVSVEAEQHYLLRVYADLSRVNHSCRRNAIVACIFNNQRSTLHAWTDITQDAKIVVYYLSDPLDCFKNMFNRTVELPAQQSFALGRCAARRHQGANILNGNKRRATALNRHRAATATAPPATAPRARETLGDALATRIQERDA